MFSLNNHYALHQVNAREAQARADQQRLAQAARQTTPSLIQRSISALAALRSDRPAERPAAATPTVRARRA